MHITTFMFAQDLSRDRQQELRRMAGSQTAAPQPAPQSRISLLMRLAAIIHSRPATPPPLAPTEDAASNA